jgi:glycosyltransferase 2 family protein
LVRALRFAPYLLILAFVAWCALALRGDLQQISLDSLLRSWNLLLWAGTLSVLNYAFRIIRWRWYLGRLGYRLPLRFAATTFLAGFAYTLSPGKVGEMVRARYYVPLGIPLSRVAAAFFAERLLDIVAMTALAGLLVASLPAYRDAIFIIAVAVIALLTSFSILPWPLIVAKCERLQPGPLRKVLLGVTSTLAATRPLLTPGALCVGFLLGLFAWGFEGFGLSILAGATTISHLDLMPSVGIYAVAVLVGALSFLPGGLGSTEAVMTTLLVASGFPLGDSIFMTLACRLLTLWLAVLLGWAAVLLLRQRSFAPAVPWQ